MIFHVKRIKYSEILFPQSWLVGGIGLSRFSLVGYGISILIGRLGWAKDDSDTQISSVENQEKQVVMAAALSIFAIHRP